MLKEVYCDGRKVNSSATFYHLIMDFSEINLEFVNSALDTHFDVKKKTNIL